MPLGFSAPALGRLALDSRTQRRLFLLLVRPSRACYFRNCVLLTYTLSSNYIIVSPIFAGSRKWRSLLIRCSPWIWGKLPSHPSLVTRSKLGSLLRFARPRSSVSQLSFCTLSPPHTTLFPFALLGSARRFAEWSLIWFNGGQVSCSTFSTWRSSVSCTNNSSGSYDTLTLTLDRAASALQVLALFPTARTLYKCFFCSLYCLLLAIIQSSLLQFSISYI